MSVVISNESAAVGPCTYRTDGNVARSGGTDFGPLKQHLVGRRFCNNEEVEMVIYEWYLVEEPNFYGDGLFFKIPVKVGQMHQISQGLC
jgi:hypothetical protein